MVLENICNHKSDKYFIHNLKKTYAKENRLITNKKIQTGKQKDFQQKKIFTKEMKTKGQ